MFSLRNSAISLWNFSEKLAILRYGYFLFHGKTALRKILKFQGETANFSEKFQREIAEFLRENMELYRQNLKILGRNTGTCISWRKWRISWRNFPLSVFSFFTCTVCDHNIAGGWIHMDFPQATGPYGFPSLTNNRNFEAYSSICRRPLHVNYTTHIYREKSTSPISPNNTLSLMNKQIFKKTYWKYLATLCNELNNVSIKIVDISGIWTLLWHTSVLTSPIELRL